MKLNMESRYELRKSVEILLASVPNNKKIQLPKKTLELLLFEEVIINKDKNIKVKLPVWSGNFLSQLDLSQIDFKGVSWSIIGKYNSGKETLEYEDEFTRKLDKLHIESNYYVKYTNTNAKINFNESFEQKFSIWDCDFENTDLSNNVINSISDILYTGNSNLSNIKASFNYEEIDKIFSSMTIDEIKNLFKNKFFWQINKINSNQFYKILLFFENNDQLYSSQMFNTDVFKKFIYSIISTDDELYLRGNKNKISKEINSFFKSVGSEGVLYFHEVNYPYREELNNYLKDLKKEVLSEIINKKPQINDLIERVKAFYRLTFNATEEWFDSIAFNNFISTLIGDDKFELFGTYGNESNIVHSFFKENASLEEMQKKYLDEISDVEEITDEDEINIQIDEELNKKEKILSRYLDWVNERIMKEKHLETKKSSRRKKNLN